MKGDAVIKYGEQTMKMKKYTMMLVFLIAMVVSISCYAKITEADLNIGGIYYGQPAADVIKKLGEPVRRQKTPPAGSAPVFKYGNAEILVKYNDFRPTVWGVWIISGDGVYTAAGIGIGSSYDAVIKAYGPADFDSVLTHSNLKRYSVQYKIPNIKPNEVASLDFEISPDKKVIGMGFDTYDDTY